MERPKDSSTVGGEQVLWQAPSLRLQVIGPTQSIVEKVLSGSKQSSVLLH